MADNVIAVSHPGKLGDALYCLPTIRYLCAKYGARADFYTSTYCEPLCRLFEQQPCIRKVIVPSDYKIENAFCGVQPWQMPIPREDYLAVYQLGFRATPDRALPDFIAASIGAPTGLPIAYDFPRAATLNEPYLVIAPGSDPHYRPVFLELVRRSPLPVVNVGAEGEYCGAGIDKTGLDMLETLPWLEKARAFIGLMSSPLVLANGFPIPKITLHDGATWDMRHVLQSPLNYYPINPSAQQVLTLLGLINYSKTLHPKDYLWIGEVQHIMRMLEVLREAHFRFEHEHRRWEYGLILRALRENNTKSVLDVGGGGSLFAPSAAWLGMEVTQIDPTPCAPEVARQGALIGRRLTYVTGDFFDFNSLERFDAVTCLSVIEHVERERDFFLKLLQHVREGGLLALTTDFHPAGQALVDGHLRTYNESRLTELAFLARCRGFEYFGCRPDYTWYEPYVNSYSFASLVMRRVRGA